MSEGTYIAYRVHPESERIIRDFCACQKIPVAYPKEERRRHVTLFSTQDRDFSKDYRPNQAKVLAIPGKWSIFPTQDGKAGLVLELDCPFLETLYNNIKHVFGVESIYGDPYKCHITFSYDVGDLDVSALKPFVAPIILEDQYCEPYKANWGVTR